MSLPYFVHSLSPAEQDRLMEILQNPPDARVYLRVKAVDLSSQGWKVHEIAKIVERNRSSVWRWLQRFEVEGIEGLWPRKSPGRPHKTDTEAHRADNEVVPYGVQDTECDCPVESRVEASASPSSM